MSDGSYLQGAASRVQDLFAEALRNHQAGHLAAAESLYRQILKVDPRHSDSVHLLGVIAHQVGRHNVAVDLITLAIGIDSEVAVYHCNLGSALKDSGRLDDAIAACRAALCIKPDYVEAYSSLGVALTGLRRCDDAVSACRAALRLKPDYALAYYNLGNALKDLGRLDDAVASYNAVLSIKPDLAEAHCNLAIALTGLGRFEDAISACHAALRVKPDYAKAYANLGNALTDLGRLYDAVAAYRAALRIQPDLTEAHYNLGRALHNSGRLDDAIAAYRAALRIKPDHTEAHNNLLYSLNYPSKFSPDEIYTEHRRWGEPYAKLARGSHANDRNPNRRLRVGYVSPDFRRHSVAYFFEPLLREHDRDLVELYCYAEVTRPDSVTVRLKALADHWRSTVGKSDGDLARQIGEDGIDILVDLAGHTANNRLLVFAAKPAPLQVTWLGYPNTTGLVAMNYRLVDRVTDPAGEADSRSSERLLRLKDGFLCYRPPPDAPKPAAAPALSNGFITFGSFNNPTKLSDATLDSWAALLRALPNARLFLKGFCLVDAGTRSLFEARLAKRGVTPDRLTLCGQLNEAAAHLGLYREIDIALDPFPYNGTATTCEALWMGVPVVTLAGDRHAGRVGASLLTVLGLDALIARDASDYGAIALGLATDLPLLSELRASLRARMDASPLCDASGFARSVEAAYRSIWKAWCLG